MNDIVTEALASLDSDTDASQRSLVRHSLKYLSWEDSQGLTPAQFVKHLEHLRAVGDIRQADRAVVDVRELGDAEITVVCVITDDMPFVVDSVISALTLEGKSPRLALHPQLWVRRDAAGQLLEILDADPMGVAPADAQLESWTLVELQRDFVHEDNTRTANHLREVVRDVRVASRDWQAMRSKAVELSQELRNYPNQAWTQLDTREAADFLEWLTDEHFLFLGYQENDLIQLGSGEALLPEPGSGLGILGDAHAGTNTEPVTLSPVAQIHAHDPVPLVLTKANSRSTVHRSAYLDYVSVRKTSPDGTVTGERRFLGLYTGRAHAANVTDIPVLRARIAEVLIALGLAPKSHSARDIGQMIETLPRDELFATNTEQLVEFASTTMHLTEQRKVKTYFRIDDFGRYISAFVFLPKDRYSTDVRIRIQELVQEFYQASSVDFSALVGDESHARLHFIAHVRDEVQSDALDVQALNRSIRLAVRTWTDDFTEIAVARLGSREVSSFLQQFVDAFPESYRSSTPASVGVSDALSIAELESGDIAIEVNSFGNAGQLEVKFIRTGDSVSLSEVLPLLQNFGMTVLDEHPFEIKRKGSSSSWILRFGVQPPILSEGSTSSTDQNLVEAIRAVWFGQAESDSFNALVLSAGLTWSQVAVIRAYSKYVRQIGSAFGQDYIQSVVRAYPHIARMLIELFASQFDPALTIDRDQQRVLRSLELEQAFDDVPILDHDRILRRFLSLILATLRTSVYMPASTNAIPRAFAFKLNSRDIPELPLPAPLVEIWVYSPRVEGVHLRFGRVARGGLRWSDRREDFRTEVLGLVKAQEVKNAVIVPVGAKGGFVPAMLPDPQKDREGWLAAGKAAYQEFVSALLDLTDNYRDGQVVNPSNVVSLDQADPYLVVAADKGTATFSDIANAIALERGFWLGDAFASGGSVGYDHKAMGITARGAWVSVQRHFRELGINTQTDPITVVGIGDMSGDVFGNGLMLSDQVRLIAAFDHRDIFIDPNPDASASFRERTRLFALPRSSWADFDSQVISAGGGVFSRSAKSIELSDVACQSLGLVGDRRTFTPHEIIQSILQAPVDLLWNGGIGTYVKAASESSLMVGDKANDAIRIDGSQLRCKVVGEGGNLGFTQLGRIEAALNGVRLNTDAIDNSAGVDTSDHEVNLKILLDTLVRSSSMSEDQRNSVLRLLTNDVAAAVLEDNYGQNVVLGNARAASSTLINVHQRFIRDLERRGLLDRTVEFLPTDEAIEARRLAGIGLTSPELAVLLAYSKIALAADLNAGDIAADSWYESALLSYFPETITNQFRDAVLTHQLRSQIITTVVCNSIVNTGGITFVYRVMEETGASAIETVHAARAALEIFDIPRLISSIDALDNQIPTNAQDALHLELRRLLDRATRWILNSRSSRLAPQSIVETYRPVVEDFAGYVRGHLPSGMVEEVGTRAQALMNVGAPAALAIEVSSALDLFVLLDIAHIAQRSSISPDRVIPVYLAVTEAYGIDPLLTAISALPRDDRWSSLARHALRADLYQATATLTEHVLTMDQGSPALTIASWEGHYGASCDRAKATLIEIASVERPDIATLSVALRVLRTLISQTS